MGWLAAIVTHVAEQGGAGGSEAEDRVFHDGLAGSNGVDPVLQVVVVVAITLGSNVFFLTLQSCPGGMRHRIFLVIDFQHSLLNCLRKRLDANARLLFSRNTGDADSASPDNHLAFRTGEDEAFTFGAAI